MNEKQALEALWRAVCEARIKLPRQAGVADRQVSLRFGAVRVDLNRLEDSIIAAINRIPEEA